LRSTPGGVGLVRSGLDGLEMSLRDAEKAMALAAHRETGVIDFGSEWFVAALFSQRRELTPVLRPRSDGLPVHLADAVSTYAAQGFSISAAGQALHVHPNTIKYRLERWHQLTGWDPRTLEGLLKSSCSLALGPLESPGARK
jgi:sugar diacid utilization regulator